MTIGNTAILGTAAVLFTEKNSRIQLINTDDKNLLFTTKQIDHSLFDCPASKSVRIRKLSLTVPCCSCTWFWLKYFCGAYGWYALKESAS